MALKSLFDKYSTTTRKTARKARRLEGTQNAVNIARATKNRDQFLEDNQRRRLALNEDLARRGMAGGTHAIESKGLFEKASERALDTLGEDLLMANQGKDIYDYKKRTRNRMQPLNILDDILGGGLQAMTLGGAFGGGGIGGGTEGLDEAFLD